MLIFKEDSYLKNNKKGLLNNLIYQFLYHVIILFIPLILAPYLTRTLGDTNLGIHSYVNSIAYYFIVIANLGILKHGQRIIANNSNDEIKLRKAFWSLYSLHFVISSFCLICYFAFVFAFVKDDVDIFLIEGIYVSSALFDITWLFYGLENFRSVVIKSLLIRIIEFVCILVFVKHQKDLPIYTTISASAVLLGQIILIPQALRQVPFIKFCWDDVKEHIKPLLVFSVAIIATSLYTVLDKILLGVMTTKENVAYYEYANKIISLPRTFAVIIGTVMFPKACKMVNEGNTVKQKTYLKISLIVVCFIGIASLFGILSVGEQLAVLYYGEDFAESGKVMATMCAFPFIIGLGEIIRSQYLIPNKHDKQYVICIVMNAIVNIVLSLIFIPIFGIYGAVIGTFAAELFGCVYQIIICRKYVSPLMIVTKTFPFLIIGGIMFGIISLENDFFDLGLASLLIKIFSGIIVFSTLSIIYIALFERDIWDMAKSKINSMFRKKRK